MNNSKSIALSTKTILKQNYSIVYFRCIFLNCTWHVRANRVKHQFFTYTIPVPSQHTQNHQINFALMQHKSKATFNSHVPFVGATVVEKFPEMVVGDTSVLFSISVEGIVSFSSKSVSKFFRSLSVCRRIPLSRFSLYTRVHFSVISKINMKRLKILLPFLSKDFVGKTTFNTAQNTKVLTERWSRSRIQATGDLDKYSRPQETVTNELARKCKVVL